MNVDELKKVVTDMDVKSDEFFQLYLHIAKKYFTFSKDSPSDFEKSCGLLMEWMNRSVDDYEDHVIVTMNIVIELFKMKLSKQKSCTGTIQFSDDTFFFDIYTSETEKDKLSEIMIKAHESISKGNIEVKDKFGKNYFKKKNK